MMKLLILCFLCLLWALLLFFQYATPEERGAARDILRGTKNLLYQEATLHNPKGDLIPDTLDDELWKQLQNRWRDASQ